MIAVDTNVLLRYVLSDDHDQSPLAVELIDKNCSLQEPALVPNIALAEVVWVLIRNRKRPKFEIVEMLWDLLDNAHLTFESRDAVERAVEEYEAGPADFADYLIATSAAVHAASPTYTFDVDAARRPPFKLLQK